MLRFAALSVLVLEAACATAAARAQYGSIRLRHYGDPTATPRVFSVQEGRIVSPELDVVQDPDGCLRGSARNNAVDLCLAEGAQSPEEPGHRVEHWTGRTGDLRLELKDRETRLRMNGYLRAGAWSIPLNATVPLGKGPQWDQLREHPAFLALAAGVAGVRGEPTEAAIREAMDQ